MSFATRCSIVRSTIWMVGRCIPAANSLMFGFEPEPLGTEANVAGYAGAPGDDGVNVYDTWLIPLFVIAFATALLLVRP